MASATLTLLMDRFYAINQVVHDDIHAARYVPQSFPDARLPLLIALWGRQRLDLPGAGGGQFSGQRNWELVLFVGDWLAGLPTESAQRNAETYTEPVIDAYISRPKLELAGLSLDGVERVELLEDSGLTSDSTGTLAVVRFPILITTRKSFSYNTE